MDGKRISEDCRRLFGGSPSGVSVSLRNVADLAPCNSGMNLVAIDTLHLFPTTLECAKLVEVLCGLGLLWFDDSNIRTFAQRC